MWLRKDGFYRWFSGYNQIKMYQDDEKHISFRTLLGIYCYTVMLFGLKSASATYQCAMSTHSNVVQIEKCGCNILTCHEHKFMWSSTKNGGILCWWHLQSRVAAEVTTSMTWKLYLTSCRLTNWRWTQPNHSWECRMASSLDSSSHPKEFSLTLAKSRASRACNLRKPLKSSEVYKADSSISKDSLQIFWVIVRSHG